MQCVHYMNRIDIHVDMKKLTCSINTYPICDNLLSGEKNGKFETAKPWFQNSIPRVRVFINSERETLLLNYSEPRDSKRQKFTMVQISKAI